MTDGPGTIEIKNAALFLDFDGTLVRITDRPDQVKLEPPMRAALDSLVELTGEAVAIISGREIKELDRFLAPLTLPSAGSHGMERRNASGKNVGVSTGASVPTDVTSGLRTHAETHDLLLEDKASSIAIHFRNAPALEQETRSLADELAAPHPSLRVIHGHMVAEIASTEQDKGGALRAFMQEAPFKGRTPVAVGDDTTDEDAFRAAQDLGGIGIRIGGTNTCAAVWFSDIDAFQNWLTKSVALETLEFERKSV